MALLDSLGKKASETTAKAMQKAKELSETASLNSMISDEEKKINNNYFQIGKLYASLHQHDCEEAFAGMLSSIIESEGKISDYRQQINDLKGVIRCEKCGGEVPRGVSFCSSCGSPMPVAETVITADCVRCENCGTSVKREMRFCTSCGKPMAQPAFQKSPNMMEAETESVGKACPGCGIVVADDSAFCTECGVAL